MVLLSALTAKAEPSALVPQPTGFGSSGASNSNVIPLRETHIVRKDWNVTSSENSHYIYVDIYRDGAADPPSFVVYDISVVRTNSFTLVGQPDTQHLIRYMLASPKQLS